MMSRIYYFSLSTLIGDLTFKCRVKRNLQIYTFYIYTNTKSSHVN